MNHASHAIVSRRRRSRGVGLVTAIFLLVVLAGLGVALVSIFSSQQQAILLDEQGVRATQAARAGIEWGLYQRLRGAGGCTDDKPDDSTAGSTTGVALAGDVLAQFSVSVSCEQVAGPGVADGEPTLARWIIRATACAPAPDQGACPDGLNNPDYVRRVIEVQI